MHRAAVWQHSSNSNNKIVHNSIENFLCNPSDFCSDDVLSFLIVFTNSFFQVTPQKIVRRVDILGYRFDVKWGCPMGSYPWGIQVFCSRWWFEMRWCLSCRTEHLNTLGITSHGTDSFHVKPMIPGHPIPKISTRQTIFRGGTWVTAFVKTIHRKDRTWSEKKSDWLHKKFSIELWTILLFELLLIQQRSTWNEHGINNWKSIVKHYWF